MTIPCRACGSPVPVEPGGPDRGALYCPACGAGFHALELLPPEKAAALRKEFLGYSLPQQGIEPSGGELHFVQPWRVAWLFRTLCVCALAAGACAFLLGAGEGFITVLLAAAAAGCAYAALLVRFNRTEVSAGDGRLRVYRGPLPPRTDLDLPSDRCGAVIWRANIPPGGCGTFARGSVFLAREGAEVPVFTDLSHSVLETAAAMLQARLDPAGALPPPAPARPPDTAPAPRPTLAGTALLLGLTAALGIAAARGHDVALFAVIGTYIVLIHEAGHWLAAVACGIPIRRFMVGLGPGVFSFLFRGTRFEFRAIPLLGFVEPGTRAAPPGAPDEGAPVPAVDLAPAGARVLFMLAGIIANLLGAAGHLWLYYRLDPQAALEPAPVLGPVRPGSAADEAGLREGDRLLSVAGRSPAAPWSRDASSLVDAARRGKPVSVVASRRGGTERLEWLPRGITAKERLEPAEIYRLGLVPAETWIVAAVAASSACALRAGDEVLSVSLGSASFSGAAGDSTQAADWLFSGSGGRPVEVAVRRAGARLSFAVEPLAFPGEKFQAVRHEPVLRWVRRDSPAWAAGFRPGDLVLSVDGSAVVSDLELRDRLAAAALRPADLRVKRGSGTLDLVLPPEPFKSGADRGVPEGRWTNAGRDGLRISSVTAALAARLPDLAPGDVRSSPAYRRERICWLKPGGGEHCADYSKVADLAEKTTDHAAPFVFETLMEPRPRSLPDCAGETMELSWGLARNMKKLLAGIFRDSASLKGPAEPGRVTGEVKESPARIFMLVALLSCFMAVFNLLPVPPLDGFRFLETLWHAAFGRPVRPRAVRHPGCAGCIGTLLLAALLGISLFAFLRDLVRSLFG